jgi:glycosyltransferase involved in cell wall biosynthesis
MPAVLQRSARDPTIAARTRTALIVTVVHNPQDSRIRHRQIAALLAAHWNVTYVAPFRAFGMSVPPARSARSARPGSGGLTCVDIRSSSGRRRLLAWRDARRVVRRLASQHDVVLVHDPELVIAVAGLRLPNLIWDVHEDPAAALLVKKWMPRPLRRPAGAAWRMAERLIERRHDLLLAEHAYQQRFRRSHPVVTNSVTVPLTTKPAGDDRVSYLGSVSMSRGCDTMIEVAQQLRRRTGGAVGVEVIGEAADQETRRALERASTEGDLIWHGFLPSDKALARITGSMAGLCLLRDLPNFRESLPTKIVEYGALGVPVVTTPLPLAAQFVRRYSVGIEVPWDQAEAVVDALLKLRSDAQLRAELGANGRAAVMREHNWRHLSNDFVDIMNKFAEAKRVGSR